MCKITLIHSWHLNFTYSITQKPGYWPEKPPTTNGPFSLLSYYHQLRYSLAIISIKTPKTKNIYKIKPGPKPNKMCISSKPHFKKCAQETNLQTITHRNKKNMYILEKCHTLNSCAVLKQRWLSRAALTAREGKRE